MQTPLLATGKISSRPYEIRLIGRRIYSAEELCYSLEQCAAFVDESIADPDLLTWLREECGLPDLAGQLEPLVKDPPQVEELVLRIMAYVGFQSPQKIREVRDDMESGRGMEPFQRRLREADLMASGGRESAALELLDGILSELPPLERLVRSRTWAKKGQIHAGSFRFEEARECCETAYRLSGGKQDLIRMLAMLLLSRGEEEYRHYLEDNPSCQETAGELEEYMAGLQKTLQTGQAGRRMKRLARNLEGGRNGAFDSALQQMVEQEQDLFRAGHAASF